MNIAVIGTGYVGLVTAAVFADFGNKVWGVDVDENKIKSLSSGKVPFFEPGLEKLVKKGLKNKKLFFTSCYQKAIPQSEIVFICVGTPSKKNGDYDLSFIYSAAKSIALSLKKYTVVCIKSTVPPSTNKKVEKIIKKHTSIDFNLASCPEFLREGSAIPDSLNPSRIVIGTNNKKARDLLLKLHQPIKASKLVCDPKSAQMIKYAANAFLATKISFINSIARLCDQAGANIDKVSLGLGLDPRIGKQFLNAGLGYGGSCFPKDTWALITYAKRLGYDFKFLKEVDRVNENQVNYFVNKILDYFNGSIKRLIITVLGLSFKPDTDDIRESRAIDLVKKLQRQGAKVRVCDPVAINNAKKVLKHVNFFSDPLKALKNSSALILATEWPEFVKLDYQKVAKLMKEKVIFDSRNVLDNNKLKKLGFYYEGVGKK